MRKHASSKVARFTLAFFLIWGAASQSLSVMLCAAGFCGHGCSMEAPSPGPAAPKPKDEHACCVKTADGPPSQALSSERADGPGCTCQIASSKLPIQPVSVVTVTPDFGAIAIDSPVESALPDPTAPPAAKVFYGSDSSPPWVPWHPDFGRAPPSA